MSEPIKRTLLLTAICLSLVPAVGLLQLPDLVSARSVALWAAALAGYWGMVMLLWMYLLGAKSAMGLVFDNLAPVLQIHKWLGKWGTLIILLHPALAAFAYGESLVYVWLPELGTEFMRHVTLGRIAFLIVFVTWILSTFLRGKMAFRPWKYLHYLTYVALPFALLHSVGVGSQVRDNTALQVYVALIVGLTIAAFVLRLAALFDIGKKPYTVVSHTKLTPEDRLLRLRPATPRRLVPRIGQYLYLKWGIISEEHPFSVLDYDPNTHELLVAYRLFGQFTHSLSAELKTGDTLQLSGPYGNFLSTYQATAQPVVFISGGIGITPFIRPILHHDTTKELWAFMAVRTPESHVFHSLVTKQLGERAVTILSQTTPTSGRHTEHGYITQKTLQKYLDDPTRYRYYLCGPQPMMLAVRTVLTGLGVPAHHIEHEQFGW